MNRRFFALASLCALGCSFDWDRFNATNAPDAAATDLGADSAMDAVDVPFHCTSDPECERGACDTVTGRCVDCTAAHDTCGTGRYCTAANVCATGCRDDQSCASTPIVVDGGAGDAGVVPGRCDPASHACVQCVVDEHCPIGTRCTAGACVPGCDASRGCPAGATCCGGGCVDLARDATHCGTCGTLCTTANGAPACVASACTVGQCNAPFGDCNGDASDGCETNTRTAVAHCGACGRACLDRANATSACAEGLCTYACATGFGDCDGDPANGCETDLARTLSACGRCDNACTFAGGVGACVGGVCTRTSCSTGRGDCDGNTANGCETDLDTDAANCRVCGGACTFAHGTGVCVAGGCALGQCDVGAGNCDGNAANGCETDLTATLAHCGACGRSCAFPRATATCTASVCALGACNAGAGNCDGDTTNGCEVDLTTAAANCGACGHVCPARANATATCAAGACGIACATNFADCNGNPADGCEVNLLTTASSCGACGVVCNLPNATAACRAGACAVGTCATGFADCDGDPRNGCEADTRTNNANCGACGRACAPAHGTGRCAASACTVLACDDGYNDCDGLASTGCETQPVADNQNCGTCGTICAAGRSCQVGRCALASFGGYALSTPAGVSWVDACAAPGAVQLLAGADDDVVGGTLPFPVEFWGSTNTAYQVSANGWVGFGIYYGNYDALPDYLPWLHYGMIPNDTVPYPAAFVLGVDQVQGGAGVCIATVGTAPNRRFVVETNGSTLYRSVHALMTLPMLGPSTFTYELVVYEGTNVIDMVYASPFSAPSGAAVQSPTNVTVGLEDFRTPQRAALFNGAITATTRIRFTPQ